MELKVCGIKNSIDLDAIRGLDIKWAGINLSPKSKRKVSLKDSIFLSEKILEMGHEVVLVTYMQTLCEVQGILDSFFEKSLPVSLQAYEPKLLKAIELPKEKKFLAVKGQNTYEPDNNCTLIFDGPRPGSGEYEKRKLPYPLPGLLAGGVKLTNLKELIDLYKPQGIDSASGTEKPDGNKCKDTIKKMIEVLRSMS